MSVNQYDALPGKCWYVSVYDDAGTPHYSLWWKAGHDRHVCHVDSLGCVYEHPSANGSDQPDDYEKTDPNIRLTRISSEQAMTLKMAARHKLSRSTWASITLRVVGEPCARPL